MNEVVLLWASISVLIVYTWRASPFASLLLVPFARPFRPSRVLLTYALTPDLRDGGRLHPAQLDHRHRVRPQALTHLMPAAQVRRQIRLIIAQAAQINDARHTRNLRGACEIRRRQAVLRFKITRRAHRMNQIKRGGHPLHRRGQRGRVKQVALHHFDPSRHAGRQTFRLPRQTPHAPALRHQQRQQPPTNVAGRARQQDEVMLVHFRHRCCGGSSLRQLVFKFTGPDRSHNRPRFRLRDWGWRKRVSISENIG